MLLYLGPCKLIAPKFKKLAAEFPEIVYAKIDVDDVPVSIHTIGRIKYVF